MTSNIAKDVHCNSYADISEIAGVDRMQELHESDLQFHDWMYNKASLWSHGLINRISHVQDEGFSKIEDACLEELVSRIAKQELVVREIIARRNADVHTAMEDATEDRKERFGPQYPTIVREMDLENALALRGIEEQGIVMKSNMIRNLARLQLKHKNVTERIRREVENVDRYDSQQHVKQDALFRAALANKCSSDEPFDKPDAERMIKERNRERIDLFNQQACAKVVRMHDVIQIEKLLSQMLARLNDVDFYLGTTCFASDFFSW